MSGKQLRMLVKAAEGGPECFDPFLVLQLGCSEELTPEVVVAAYKEKQLLSEGMEEVGIVVEKAFEVLSDPILLKACVGCVEAVHAEHRKARKKPDPDEKEQLVMKRFESIISTLNIPERTKTDYALQRSEKRKSRKKALRDLQNKQLQEKQDTILFDIGTASRSKKSLERLGQEPREKTPTPPPSPTTGAIDASTGLGGAAAYRDIIISACIAKEDVKLCNVLGKTGGRQVLPIQDEVGLAVLERHGFLTLTTDDDVQDCCPATAERRHLTDSVEVKSGCVAGIALWLLPVLAVSQTRATVTMKGPTDNGSFPTAAVQDGYCQLLSLFSCEASCQVTKRKGNHHNTAVLKVQPTVFITPVNLVEQGSIVELNISVWVSKGIPLEVGQNVAQAAFSMMNEEVEGVDSVTNLNLWKEDSVASDVVFISIQMKSSKGAVWCGWSLGGKGTKATLTGERAAQAVLRDYSRGGLIPDCFQDHAALLMSACPATSRILINTATPALHTAITLITQQRPNVKFSFASPPFKGKNKRSIILECTVN
eukprot:TRINITY_DN9743_c1_g1_i1.p1 TRINITY_DN9743_c1_g1~~TRINITY_DN9743_c1_g1_i1.p1  ORF type:complete len:539 (+),score=182.16 TRINITY_DN9743_c1_g1_i1:93-1709(+)